MNFYNEFDNDIASHLSGLIAAGVIPNGNVDARSIELLQPSDLNGYRQCHFFAGIGGWGRALEIAGWPADRPVWTGSCPCQPFSVAGKGKGEADERHLWPVFFNLIEACRPQCIFGEQVASKAALGWFDGVSADLEGIGYTCGAVIVGAHSAGADHQRQRLYWMAYAGRERDERRGIIGGLESEGREVEGEAPERQRGRDAARHRVSDSTVADTVFKGSFPSSLGAIHCREKGSGTWDGESERRGPVDTVVQPIGTGLEGHTGYGDGSDEPGRVGTESTGPVTAASDAGFLADSESEGSSRRGAGAILPKSCEGCGNAGTMGNSESHDQQRDWQRIQVHGQEGEIGGSSFWADSYPILCRDGKYRRVPSESSLFPLADGVSSRDMEQVRSILQGMGYGDGEIKKLQAHTCSRICQPRRQQ